MRTTCRLFPKIMLVIFDALSGILCCSLDLDIIDDEVGALALVQPPEEGYLYPVERAT
jgi:hypothetical protein